ncbi:MAG: SDR family oxidoreductase [Candidatus Omnitrophica bacterium]|jgi:thioester reductase-like protein|nr:SDR family oxidoreductase [Candidatus Omnitrophota bacterium]
MANKLRTIFITGATGLLGSYLSKIFLENGHKVYALARDKGNLSADIRVREALKLWDTKSSAMDNLIVLKGDITKKNLGLDQETLKKLCTEVEEIYHFAAVINFNWLLLPIRAVNVIGTERVLEFAEECKKQGALLKVNHISTAYIYGDYQGEFKENDLDLGQRFRTTYEQSKFEAEKSANKYRQKGLWIDIFRPPIVIGHSKTGKVLKFNNIYQLLSLCNLGLFDKLPIKGAFLRLVPVDYIAEAIYLISSRTKEQNKNYHLFPTEPVLVEKIIDCGCKMINAYPPKAVSLKDFDLKKLSPAQKAILENNILAINFNNKLNSKETCRLLAGYGLVFPQMNEENLLRAFKYFAKKMVWDE